MVRTKADNSARKAVAAKAPRKALASTGGSSSSSFGSPKAANKYAGGNTACPRPVPDWQKGVSSFFTSPCKKGQDKENSAPDGDGIVELGEGSGAGCSSQGSSSSTSNSSQGENILEDDD